MRRRTIVLIAAILILLLTGGYTFYWFRLKQIVADDIVLWAAQQRAQGFSVSINEHPAIGGFPFVLTANLGQPDITAPGGLWRWQGPFTELLIWPWSPFDLSFLAPGGHHLTVAGNAPRDVVLYAGAMMLSETITPDNVVTDIRLAGADLHYTDNAGVKVSLDDAMITGHLPHPAKPNPDTSILDLVIDAAAIDLPASARPVLGPRIAKVHLVTQLMGAVADAPPREALASWRDGGGVLQLRESALDWGPLSASGDGTIALDENMQPLVAGTVHVSGLPETLDLLSAAGLIASGQATMAKVMFGAVAQTPAGGGRPQVSVPLTIQNNYLFVGPIKLTPLKPIDWSQLP